MTTQSVLNLPKLTSDGQLFIGDGTGNPKAATLTAGSGITLTNGHGSISIAASGGSSALTFITKITASNSAFVSFNNNLSSTYDCYFITVDNLRTAIVGGVSLEAQFGQGGTPTYITSGYYDSVRAGSQANMKVTTGSNFDASADVAANGVIYVQNINDGVSGYATLNSQFTIYSSIVASGSPGVTSSVVAAGYPTLQAMTSIRLFFGGGNISTGVFRLYGYSN